VVIGRSGWETGISGGWRQGPVAIQCRISVRELKCSSPVFSCLYVRVWWGPVGSRGSEDVRCRRSSARVAKGLWVTGPVPVMRQTPNSGSKKARPTKSVQSSRACGRVLEGGYARLGSGRTNTVSGMRSRKNHHTVLVTLGAEVFGTHTSKARRCSTAGPK
jgi:hypothetical protein